MSAEGRKRSNSPKLQHGRLKSDVQKNMLVLRTEKHWNKFPGEVTEWPIWDVFRKRLGEHLSGMFLDLHDHDLGREEGVKWYLMSFPNPSPAPPKPFGEHVLTVEQALVRQSHGRL